MRRERLRFKPPFIFQVWSCEDCGFELETLESEDKGDVEKMHACLFRKNNQRSDRWPKKSSQSVSKRRTGKKQ